MAQCRVVKVTHSTASIVNTVVHGRVRRPEPHVQLKLNIPMLLVSLCCVFVPPHGAFWSHEVMVVAPSSSILFVSLNLNPGEMERAAL